MSEFRTHKCDEIRLEDVGKEVKISGFVENIRDLGGLVFLDIRDMYGVTQVVTSKEETDNYIMEMKKMFGPKNVRRIATNRFGTRFICKVKDVVEE